MKNLHVPTLIKVVITFAVLASVALNYALLNDYRIITAKSGEKDWCDIYAIAETYDKKQSKK
jgi:hypothetical protein